MKANHNSTPPTPNPTSFLLFIQTTRALCPPGSRMLSNVASLEGPLVCCLGPLIHYLQEFNLDRVLRSDRYMPDGRRARLPELPYFPDY